MTTPRLRVEVVAALPERQAVRLLDLAVGSTVRQAVEESGLLNAFPEFAVAAGRVGIWGRPVDPDQPLRDGDRVELYRPLVADPKTARRQRAARDGT